MKLHLPTPLRAALLALSSGLKSSVFRLLRPAMTGGCLLCMAASAYGFDDTVWYFEGNAASESGDGLHSVVNPTVGPEVTFAASGLTMGSSIGAYELTRDLGQAAVFTGGSTANDSYITLGDAYWSNGDGTLNAGGSATQSFTIITYVNMAELNDEISFFGTGNQSGTGFAFGLKGNKLDVLLKYVEHCTLAATPELSTNTWYCFAMSFDADTKISSMYVNGELVGTVSTDGKSFNGAGGAGAGIGSACKEKAQGVLNGMMAELQILSGAKSQEEILAAAGLSNALTLYWSAANSTIGDASLWKSDAAATATPDSAYQEGASYYLQKTDAGAANLSLSNPVSINKLTADGGDFVISAANAGDSMAVKTLAVQAGNLSLNKIQISVDNPLAVAAGSSLVLDADSSLQLKGGAAVDGTVDCGGSLDLQASDSRFAKLLAHEVTGSGSLSVGDGSRLDSATGALALSSAGNVQLGTASLKSLTNTGSLGTSAGSLLTVQDDVAQGGTLNALGNVVLNGGGTQSFAGVKAQSLTAAGDNSVLSLTASSEIASLSAGTLSSSGGASHIAVQSLKNVQNSGGSNLSLSSVGSGAMALNSVSNAATLSVSAPLSVSGNWNNDNGNATVSNGDLAIQGVLSNENGSLTVTDHKLSLSSASTKGGTLAAKEIQMKGSNAADSVTTESLSFSGAAGKLQLRQDSVLGTVSNIAALQLDGGNSIAHSLSPDTEVTVADLASLELRNSAEQVLSSLNGGGSLRTASSLRLNRDSSIASLSGAGTLTLGESLSVSGAVSGFSTIVFDGAAGGSLTMGSLATPVRVHLNDNYLSSLKHLRLGTASLTLMSVTDAGASLDDVTLDISQYSDSQYVYSISKQGNAVLISARLADANVYKKAAQSAAGRAGMEMLSAVMADENAGISALSPVFNALDDLIQAGNSQGADRLASAVAGASIPALGMALSQDMQRQLRSIRNRSVEKKSIISDEDDLPVSAWINAEANRYDLSADGTASGYSLDSVGGTLGAELQLAEPFAVGLAISAMHGSYNSDAADTLSGDVDSIYASAYARYEKNHWQHSFVASVGSSDISLDRSVSSGSAFYRCHDDSNAIAYGFLYELGRSFDLDEEGDYSLMPVFNVALSHAKVDGYSESGSDAALKVADMDYTQVTLGAGFRYNAVLTRTMYERPVFFQSRAMLKLDVADREGCADVAFAKLPRAKQQLKSRENSVVGAELGVGLTVPVMMDGGELFVDASAELRQDYNQLNATVGYRIHF